MFFKGRRARRGPRVLIIVQNLSVPTDRRVWFECKALIEAGWGASVICPRGAGEPAHRVLEGVSVHTYKPPRQAIGRLGFIWEFAYCWLRAALLSVKVLTCEGFDAIQACNPPDTYWLLGVLYRAVGKRFVYDQHDLCPELFRARFGTSGLLHRAQLLLERATYAVSDHVIVTNDHCLEVAHNRGGVDLQRLAIVRSAPDPMEMRRGDQVPALRHGRRYLVCYLGIMGVQDGVDGLMNSINHYVHTLGREDCHFGLLGFGDRLEDLKKQAVQMKLSDYVTFTGKVGMTEIGEWLSTADLGVTPDPKNEFNDFATMNKTLEYMAYGLPVVAYDLVETRRSAQGAAHYVAADDDLSYAKAIAQLLDDPVRRKQMGERGRNRIVADLCWSKQAAVYVGLYADLLGADLLDSPRQEALAS